MSHRDRAIIVAKVINKKKKNCNDFGCFLSALLQSYSVNRERETFSYVFKQPLARFQRKGSRIF